MSSLDDGHLYSRSPQRTERSKGLGIGGYSPNRHLGTDDIDVSARARIKSCDPFALPPLPRPRFVQQNNINTISVLILDFITVCPGIGPVPCTAKQPASRPRTPLLRSRHLPHVPALPLLQGPEPQLRRRPHGQFLHHVLAAAHPRQGPRGLGQRIHERPHHRH